MEAADAGAEAPAQAQAGAEAVAGGDALKLYWDHFFKAETGTYEKSIWLDLFLAEFLIRVSDGANPKELINFCPVSGVVSLVGCELLCGIHRVTSSINAHYAVPLPALDAALCSARGPVLPAELTDVADGESKPQQEPPTAAPVTSLFTRANAQSSAEILRRYLLGGVAWRCLLLLKALGVEGLSCCRQLSSVLIWLYGELGGSNAASGGTPRQPGASPAPPPPLPAKTPIHQLFSQKIWSKQKVSGNQGSKANSAASSEKSYTTGRSRHKDSEKARRKPPKADASSDSADSGEGLHQLNRSLAVRLRSGDDFDYFELPARSPDDYPESLYSDPYYSPKKPKPKPDDYMTDKHREIINSEVSTFEFTLTITDLLQELCRAESSLSGTEGSQISVQCINFTLRSLCSLQFGSLPAHATYDSLDVSRIKVALTELLIVSLDKVLIHSDLCAKLINNGILPMLLRILEDVICKCSRKYHTKEEQNRAKAEPPSKTESENLLKFVFGIGYSITAFFHCLLMQCRTLDKLREFTDQFKLYGECLKGGLLKDCIELMIRIPGVEEDSVLLIKKLIDSIGRLVSGMKRVRSEVVHTGACPRTRHKVCRQRVSAGMHHHHDILGEAGTGLPLSSACCISVLYGTLTSLVTDEEVSAQSVLRNKILRVMLSCGVCCCFSPGFLMECVVRLMLTHNGVANLCLQLLERTVYGDLGASVLVPKVTDQLPCSICEPCDDKRDLVRKYCPHGVSPIERKSVWSFLIHYNSLLQLDNHNNVLHATVSHLLRVTPKCRMEMKYELLFSVIYPTFIVSKHRYMIRLEESAYFLTVSCLNIFASLLNTVSFAEQFIQKGGLSYVLELVSLSEFSDQCCSILEIAIIVEIFKLTKDNSDVTYFREISSLASVQMLFKSLSEVTDKCYKIYKLKLPVEKFEELCDVTKERESLSFAETRTEQPTRKSSIPQAMKTAFASSENVTEDCVEDFIEVLKNIWTFWKSCAGLCLYSPMFREYIVSEGVFLDSYALLKVLLHHVCEGVCSAPEVRVLIKILEALLTVQFAVSDVTSGRSKETSCALLREALAAPAGVLDLGAGEGEGAAGGGLRALCEALIRVAGARASREHCMPRRDTAKVPPLGCASGSSSAAGEGSSSEGSARAAPYASEHSDRSTGRALGYEADVEVGKLDLHTSYKTRKQSSSASAMSSGTGYPAPVRHDTVQCAEYSPHGELAHPELCVIVVDVLTHLIHRLLSSAPEAPRASLQQAGAGLARACCARLAGALGRARPAPPQLLQRLLAPRAARLLTDNRPQLQDLQRSILELVHVLAAQSVTPPELGSLLRLLAAPSPPLGLLLPALARLAASAAPHTPDVILGFPVRLGDDDTQNVPEDYVTVNISSSQSQHAENNAKRLHDAHLRLGIKSAWSRAAVRCGIEGAGWAPWLQGFALTMWLRCATAARATRDRPPRDHSESAEEWHSEWQELEPKRSPPQSPGRREPPRPAELAHVFSAGHDSLLFEVWLDTAAGNLTFRLSRPEPSTNRVVGEARVRSVLPPNRWSCVAVNVRELLIKRRIHIQVTVYINGCESETVSLPLQGILVRKVTPTIVLIGDAVRPDGAGAGDGDHDGSGSGGGYHLSHVTLYRSPVLTGYSALHLTAHGPDHACQVQCDTPNFPLVLTPEVLDSDIDWDQMFELSGAALRELHEAALLVLSARAPHVLNLYHQAASAPTVFAGRVTGSGGLMGASGAGGAAGGLGSIPEALQATWTGAPLASRHGGLAPALHVLGGPSLLLYLLARVVELDGTEEEQALALSILLRVCRADGRLYARLYGSQLDMVHTVLAAGKCRLGHHVLKVMMDEACSAPVLTSAGAGGAPLVVSRPDSALLRPRLLVLLTRAWRHLHTQELVWEVEDGSGSRVTCRGSLWALTLCCMRALLADGGSPEGGGRRAFNHYQMSRVGLLRHLLTACKERFLNSECGPLDPCASAGLVELVRGLMGAPPTLDRLALLCDFLLIMHQASDTFVTHSRANFYFLLSPEPPDSSSFPRGLLARRRSARRANTRGDVTDTRSSSSVTSEDVDNVTRDTNRDEDKLDQSSVESTKQMKGIINMQIKEGRKHNISSTSENSDITGERVEADETGARDEKGARDAGEDLSELAEYVVVGEGGAAAGHVNFDGLYHQRAVRAGAEPGWTACEGLLLLLRDAISMLPDHAIARALCGAVQPESLVVLGNHPAGAVRAALVRVVAALQRRAAAASELARRLRAPGYYLHLANQISLYPGTWELATACAALLTKCDVPLEDQLDDDVWSQLSDEAARRGPPLLALLPASLRDVPLAHNIALLVRRLIDKASLKMLSEVSVAEVVVRAIRGVGLMGPDHFEGRQLLLEDLHELLNRLAVKALASAHSMQTISELHHMLSFVELTAESDAVSEVAREAQRALFAAQLAWLERRLHSSYQAHAKYANYFTTVLSSAVSLGSDSASRMERTELAARHLATVARAVAFLVRRSPRNQAAAEGALVDKLLATLLPAVSGASPQRPKWWVSSGADWVSPLQELFWWAASPAPGVRVLQPQLLRALYRAPAHTLQLLAPADPPAMRKLAVYLLTILKHIHLEAETGSPPVELSITDWARGWAVSTQAGLAERLPAGLQDEAERLLRADEERWARAADKQHAAIAKVVFSKDALANKLTETAMGITRQVVDIQNGERKAFMEHLRRAQSEAVACTQRWQQLIDSYTHEQAVWHDARSYPQSWQLDATEGPGRVRVRLRRAHLRIPPRFLKPHARYKAEIIDRLPPLRTVVGGAGAVGGAGGGLRGGLVARLQLHETVAHMARVTYVTVASETPGELLLSDRCIHFVPEDSEHSEQWQKGEEPSPAQSWPLEAVVQVCARRWCLQECAAELFLSSGHAHLLAFAGEPERAAFLRALAACHLPNRTEADTLTEAMTQWRNGAITNWEYLMRLNGLGGRSYNDLMQYPVLPFVVADYTSRILDLDDPKSFRDLAKPMAVQNKNREQHYINTYNDLKVARREGCSPLLSRQPHHYASLYSNSGGVLHYLVRLPPFTELFLNYQDNNFDMPDRTFHSLATTWRLITQDSPTDVKELIPELFYLPELFHNNEGLNLGVRQCGAAVDDVELPPWAPDARLFTLVQRQALEAPHVTERLPLWVDLVFGYRQTGQAAVDAVNVFPACTYYGFDPSALPDELDRTAAEAMVRTYGQAPRQLLRQPHPRIVPDLAPSTTDQVSVWAGVEGARWGRYCGSPALPPPAAVLRCNVAGGATLHATAHARTVAVASRCAAPVPLPPPGDGSASGQGGGGAGACSVAVLSWGHSDHVVRLKTRRDARPDLLLHVPALDQITKVSSSLAASGCASPVFLGHASGRILALSFRPAAGVPGAPRARTRQLHAHCAPVSDLHVCARAGLLASASLDGTLVLWDLHSLSYIRTLPNRNMLPATLVTISETLCDVASVHEPARRASGSGLGLDDGLGLDTLVGPGPGEGADSDSYEKDDTYKYKSLIRVHTVNARFVGSVKVAERVTCVCYSNAPEGISVNCVAAGLSGGGVRLYSSWDLRPVTHVLAAARGPLLSLTYSSDSSLLFGCYAEGLAVAWESGAQGKPARVLPAHALL